jgi:hypothetical protein
MYRNAEVETPDTLSHQGYRIDVDHPTDGSLQSTDTSATAISPPHFRADSHREIMCNECSEHFPHKSALDNHAKQTTHGAYACSCGVTFTRLDVLDRHIQTFNPKTFYPCTYCSKFSGLRAFTRRDHLTQHLRGYHKIENSTESITDPQLLLESTRNAKRSCLSCPHEDCLYYQEAVDNQTPLSNFQNGNMWFHSQKDCTKHMRDVHDESLYPCDFLGCDRIKGKGFCRKRDLLKHKINYHIFSDSTL